MSVARACQDHRCSAPVLAVATGVLPSRATPRSSCAGATSACSRRRPFAPASRSSGPPSKGAHEIEVWRSGESMLVRFLDAKERGKFVVRHDGEQWLIAPGARKPVRLKTVVPALRRRHAGTRSSACRSSAPTPSRARVRESDAERWRSSSSSSRATSTDALFPSARYVVREAAKRPVRATLPAAQRPRSDRDRVLRLDRARRRPTRAASILSDLLRKGAASEVEVLELEERTVPARCSISRTPTAPASRSTLGAAAGDGPSSRVCRKQNHWCGRSPDRPLDLRAEALRRRSRRRGRDRRCARPGSIGRATAAQRGSGRRGS